MQLANMKSFGAKSPIYETSETLHHYLLGNFSSRNDLCHYFQNLKLFIKPNRNEVSPTFLHTNKYSFGITTQKYSNARAQTRVVCLSTNKNQLTRTGAVIDIHNIQFASGSSLNTACLVLKLNMFVRLYCVR